MLADSVGLALQVVLETLSPPERVACVLHDLFSVPFDEIAEIMGRSKVAVRQLASRARRRVAGRPVPDSDLARQWDVVGAFYSAAREGDFQRLLELLDPDVVLRIEDGAAPGASKLIRGAHAVAQQASGGAQAGRHTRMALVNGGRRRGHLRGRPSVCRVELHGSGREDRGNRDAHRSRAASCPLTAAHVVARRQRSSRAELSARPRHCTARVPRPVHPPDSRTRKQRNALIILCASGRLRTTRDAPDAYYLGRGLARCCIAKSAVALFGSVATSIVASIMSITSYDPNPKTGGGPCSDQED